MSAREEREERWPSLSPGADRLWSSSAAEKAGEYLSAAGMTGEDLSAASVTSSFTRHKKNTKSF